MNRYTYCHNNSIYYNDKSGNAVETVVDVAGLAYDSYEFAKDPSLVNGLFWVWSAASIIIPFIPGSYVARGVSTGTKLISGAGDIYQTANRLENASTVAETVTSTVKASENFAGSVTDARQLLSSDEFIQAVNGSSDILTQGKNPEYFYRTMSANDYEYLLKNKLLSPTGETFISPSMSYSSKYQGVLVEFKMQPGTTDLLTQIGVRNDSILTNMYYGNMPFVQKGWTNTNAFFKAEGDVINIGLGHGNALDIFNNNIDSFNVIKLQ